jgi:hypothetical protein
MRVTTVEQLLRELERDQVVPVRYARRSLPARLAPAVAMLVLAVAVTASGVVLGRL